MIGRSINKKIRTELEDRREALGKKKEDVTSADKSTYKLDDLAIRTSYVRLVSPVYGSEIKGRLLQSPEFIYSKDTNGSPLVSKVRTIDNFDKEYWNTQNRGKVPPAGITSVNTSYMGEGATINTTKEATIELTCFNLVQYEQLVEEFIMIGRILYLEFGWSNPKIDSKRITADTRNFLTTKLDDDNKATTVLDMDAIEKYPQELILNTSGNTDLFVGIVKNYEAKANENGGFDFTITMVTTGAAMYDSSFGQNNSEMVTLSEPENPSDKELSDEEATEAFEKELKEAFEKPSADVRDEMILMAKLRGIIQEDFGITDMLSYAPTQPIVYRKATDSTTQFTMFSDSAGTASELETLFKQLGSEFESKDFSVEYDKGEYIIAKHKSNDLIISMIRVEEPQQTNEEITFDVMREGGRSVSRFNETAGIGMYINYWVSMRYLEDNVLNRIFGIADDKGVIRGGIRSCYYKDDEFGISLENNKMMMHDVIVPKNLNDILINTNATQNVLKRNAAGAYPDSFATRKFQAKGETFKWTRQTYSFTRDTYAKYTKSLSEMISTALPLFNNNEDSKRDSDDPPTSIPNTSPADFRHIYVNVDVVQRAFLGAPNEPFYERNTFQSNKGFQETLKNGSGYINESTNFTLDPMDPLYHPNSAVETFKEGMNNLLDVIHNNLYELPMFELGGNLNLPGYIGVTDMRYSKEDVAYTFDSFSRTSIVKSVDLSSQIPDLVQLAAYFGTSQVRMDRVLGNQATNMPVDLQQNTNDKYKKIKQKEYSQGKYRGLNFGKSEYLENLKEAQTVRGAGNNRIVGVDPERADANTSSTNLAEGEYYSAANGAIQSTLKLTRDISSIFSKGIATKLIKTYTSNTKSNVDLQKTPEDKTIRDNEPNLNENLVASSDKINKLITAAGGKQDSTDPFASVINKGNITFNAVGTDGKNIPQTYQFNLTQGDISEDYRKSNLAISTHPDFQHYIEQILYNSDKQAFNKLQGKLSFFTLTIVIDGIAGIFPGDAFLISHLPAYIKNKFYFIVTNVEQSLTSEGWATTITALQKARRKTIENAIPIEEDLAIAYTPVEGATPRSYDQSDVYDGSLYDSKQGRFKGGQRVGNPDPLTGPLPAEENSTNQRLLRDTDEDQDPADAQAGLTADQQSQIPRNTAGPMPSREADEPGPPAPPDADYDPNAVAERLNDERGIAIMNPKTAGKLQIGMDFELKRETPKVMPDVKPFVPYELTQNGTAQILISQTGDGQVIVDIPPDGPQQQIKVYPGGDASDPGQALTFNLGVADILSVDEVNDIIDTYVDLGGDKDFITKTMEETYTKVDIADSDEVTNSEEAGRKFGSWDKKRGGSSKEEKVVVYVKNEKADIISKLGKQVSGNPDLKDPNNNTASSNQYFDDIIHAIITQPERTNIIGKEIVLPGDTQEVEVEPVVDVEPLIETETDDDENQEDDTSESSGTDGAESNPEVVVEEIPEQTKVTPPRVAVSKKIVTPGVVVPTKANSIGQLRMADYVELFRYATRAENNAKPPLLGQAKIMLNKPYGLDGITPIVRGGEYGDIKVFSYVDTDQFNDMYSQLFPGKVKDGKLPNSRKKYERMAIGIFEFKLIPFNGYEGLVSAGDTINVLGLGTGDSVTNIDAMSSRAKNIEFRLAARTASQIADKYFNKNYGVETSYDAEGQVIDGVKPGGLAITRGEVQRN